MISSKRFLGSLIREPVLLCAPVCVALPDAGSSKLDLAAPACVAKLVDDAVADAGGEVLTLVTALEFLECLDEFASDETCSARAIIADNLRARIAGIIYCL
jgi:hypothetical protein